MCFIIHNAVPQDPHSVASSEPLTSPTPSPLPPLPVKLASPESAHATRVESCSELSELPDNVERDQQLVDDGDETGGSVCMWSRKKWDGSCQEICGLGVQDKGGAGER